MSKPILQTITFKASPHEVYEILMDSEKHAAFSASRAEISREIGGVFTAYDGYIRGKNLELVPDKKIVQSWRAVDWPEDHFSTVTFLFTAVPDGTQLNFSHVDVPDGTEEEFAQGWVDNYWELMKKFLEDPREKP